MVSGLMQLMQDSYLSPSLCSCSKDSITEIILGNYLRTTKGKQDATLLDALQALHVETRIAFQCITAKLLDAWQKLADRAR